MLKEKKKCHDVVKTALQFHPFIEYSKTLKKNPV